MPRARKTSSGAKAQPVQAITGQEYGRGVEQEKLQKAMPAPAEQQVTSLNQPQTQTAESPDTSTPSRPAMDFAAMRSALEGTGGLLNRPDDRPDVPFTATLNDPSARFRLGLTPPANRTGEFMRELSRRTGDNLFADLAAKAGL